MHQFTTLPEGFRAVRKAILLRAVPTSLITAGVGSLLSYYNTSNQEASSSLSLGFVPVLLGMVAFGLYRSVALQQKLFNSYRLTFDDTSLTREQHNTPTLSLPYDEVTEIVQNANRSFTVKGNSSVRLIGIPAQVTDYPQVETLLGSIRHISVQTTEPLVQKFSGLVSLLTLGLMAAVYLATNKAVVGVSGTALLLGLGYAFVEIQRSQNLDGKTKRINWFLPIVLASILGVMYIKLTA